MTVRVYKSAEAFKQALEQRLRSATKTGAEFARRRQLLVFDRFLARVVSVFGRAATLKGGLVLELRLDRARTTKDIDLRLTGSADNVLARLQQAARSDLGDFITFEVRPDEEHPEIQADGMIYEGLRFRTECRVAGNLFGQPFGVDVAFGDPVIGEPDVVVADDTLGFAGIEPPTLRLYPIETHIAEKLHAYTLPRSRPNTRVKDLPDIALLASAQPLDGQRLRKALDLTFEFRKTHELPTKLPEPAPAWTAPYAAMARQDTLPWNTLVEVTTAARRFLDPVLSEALNAQWVPESWLWLPRKKARTRKPVNTSVSKTRLTARKSPTRRK